MIKKKRNLVSLTIVVALMVITLIGLNLYARYIQILELGGNFTAVFWTNFNVNILVWITVFVFVFLLIFINALIIRSNLSAVNETGRFLTSPFLLLFSSFIALIASSAFGSDLTQKFLMFTNSELFNLGDPVFYQDIGYYVFQRPLMMALVDGIVAIMQLLFTLNLVCYIAMHVQLGLGKIKGFFSSHEARGVVMHLAVSIFLFFLAKATTYKFQAESILTAQNGEFVGAGWTQINVWLPYYRFAPYLLITVVLLGILFLTRFKVKPLIYTVALFPTAWILTAIIASFMQGFVVSPNEAAKEAPYIAENIKFTRAGYNLTEENLIERDFPIAYDLTAADIVNNQAIVDNIRITDYTQNIQILNQIQNIRNYYRFLNSDIVTYSLNGRKTAVYVTARELNTGNLDSSAKNYINTRMKYTHGLGIVMNPINAITSEGQPATIIKDIPTRSIDGAPLISEPRIYFGESTSDYVITGTKSGEIDDISGDGYTYSGAAGIRLSFGNRLLFSLLKADSKMLVSGQITADSKLLINRNVVERARLALPFLTIDDDPCIIVDDDGSLKWVVDAYTSTASFPYSEFTGNFNYIRNSVKIVIDAYNGDLAAYIIDKNDPIIKSYARMYPDVFEEGDLPEGIAAHIRYPETLFAIQADKMAKYHVTDSKSFYQKDDMWAFAKEKLGGEKAQPVVPYYSLVQLDNQEELVAMIPFTLVNKENLASWLSVRCESSNYGQLVLYRFPAGQNIYGTYQVENKIDTDPAISRDLTLWGQGGSGVVRGNMVVIPVKNSLLYIEPVYISSGSGGISEVKGVVVAYSDQVVMAETLDKALASLFGVRKPQQDENEGTKAAIERVTAAFEEYTSATKQGDWASAATALANLEELMKVLEAYGGEL